MLKILSGVFLIFGRIKWARFGQRVATVVEPQHALRLNVREKVVAALEVFVQVLDVLGDDRRTGPVESQPTPTSHLTRGSGRNAAFAGGGGNGAEGAVRRS